jgi:hypothetical protein
MAIQFDNTNTGTATLRPATTGTIALTLPSADGTSGQALTTDGAGQLAFTTVGGGGGLTGFTAAESTAAPNATVYVDSLTASAASTNADVAFVAKGTGATLAQVPTSTSAGGNKRGIYATDFQKIRTISSQVASGSYSVIVGGIRNTASNDYDVVVGGDGNNASGQYSFIAGGLSNSASGLVSVIAGGNGNNASSSYVAILGGNGNNVGGSYSGVVAGSSHTINGAFSAIVGGTTNNASGNNSIILSGGYGNTRSIIGNVICPASLRPISTTSGVQQLGTLLLGRETTNSTATRLTSDTNAATTTNQVILPNNSAYFFRGEVIAGVTGAGDTKGWTIEGVIKRGANAASTVLVGTTVMSSYGDAGAVTWIVALTADTTNGGLAITVTGAAATTIRWVAQIRTTEMTY